MRILLKQNETSFNQLFEDFLTSCKVRGLANTTIDSYRSHMHCIEKYLEVPNTISELEKRDIDNMIVAMRENDLGANTIKSYLRVFSVFVNWCRENGLTSLKIPPYKGEEVIKETYTDEELKVLLIKPNMKKCSFEEYRNWVIINLLLDCGCRAAAIRAIENRDVDLQNGLISYRHTKNRKVQVLPLCSTMIIVLKEYMGIRKGKPDDKLFCTIEGLPLSTYALRVGISRYNKRRGVCLRCYQECYEKWEKGLYTESAKKAIENADAAGTYRHRTISGGMGQKRATEDLGHA